MSDRLSRSQHKRRPVSKVSAAGTRGGRGRARRPERSAVVAGASHGSVVNAQPHTYMMPGLFSFF